MHSALILFTRYGLDLWYNDLITAALVLPPPRVLQHHSIDQARVCIPHSHNNCERGLSDPQAHPRGGMGCSRSRSGEPVRRHVVLPYIRHGVVVNQLPPAYPLSGALL